MEGKGEKGQENKSSQMCYFFSSSNQAELKRKEMNLDETFYNPYLTLLKIKETYIIFFLFLFFFIFKQEEKKLLFFFRLNFQRSDEK